MCGWMDDKKIAANQYLSQAKKRNKGLKKLKSVSRAYRKSQIRELKARAADLMQQAETERQINEFNRRQAEHLNEVARYNQAMHGNSLMGRAASWMKF